MKKLSQLPGSIADRMHKHLNDVPRSKLEEGAKVEREHTNDKHLQKLIALDHILEDSSYYPKLKKMEKEAMYSGFFDELTKISWPAYVQDIQKDSKKPMTKRRALATALSTTALLAP